MIPKSLHTVTALVNVARIVTPKTDLGTLVDPLAYAKLCVAEAARVLGYPDATDDPYGLRAKAIAVLCKPASVAGVLHGYDIETGTPNGTSHGWVRVQIAARSRDAAARVAERMGHTVRSVNMIG